MIVINKKTYISLNYSVTVQLLHFLHGEINAWPLMAHCFILVGDQRPLLICPIVFQWGSV